MRSFAGRDILSLKDFEREEFFHVFEVAAELEPIARSRRNTDMLKEKTMVTAFYQPSTRTRLAHEAAMHRLGGHVTGFSDAKMTRAGDWYQESIKDTVKMLEYYGDVIVMRHFQQGAPHEAAKWASVPIINGGDGWGEHPTQILTDLYTVLTEKGRIDGLKWLAVGDMRMRTMHSLGYALTQFDCPITFVAPPDMSLTDEFKADLRNYNLNFTKLTTSNRRLPMLMLFWSSRLFSPITPRPARKPASMGRLRPTTRSRANCSAPKQNQMPFCCIRCRAWMKSRPMWTLPAGHATGRKPTMVL
jgi:aspartate carbamoyltransferase catalytic subunit